MQTTIPRFKTVPSVTPSITDETARRTANSYLSREVGIPFGAIDGIFIPMKRPIWQFAIEFHLPRYGRLGIMGTIDVDAETGQPVPLIPKEILKIQDRSDAIIRFYTQAAAA